ITDEGLHTGRDEMRGSLVADIEALQGRLDELVKGETVTIIIEGHLSHYLEGSDAVIVLRTRPGVLAHRLEERAYFKEKVRENMEAEALDVILVETTLKHDMVYEVETTTSSPEDAAIQVDSIIEHLAAGNFEQVERYLPGRFDWSEEVF
ncbi:MAG: AAA family ATPase, partial [Methanosarcinales archaeon]|nr:AAA family ATPase [Methanosarcinales archaeon]